MTFEEVLKDIKAIGAKMKSDGRAMTIQLAMRRMWEAGIEEGMRVHMRLIEQGVIDQPAPPAAPDPVSGDAEAVARLTRVSDIGPLVGTLLGPRDD